MYQIIKNTCLVFAALLSIASPISNADDNNPWALSEYGPLLSCTSITQDQKGGLTLRRYLFLPADTAGWKAMVQSYATSGTQCVRPGAKVPQASNAIQVLTDRHTKAPEQVHFLYESYQLNAGHLIRHGHMIQGEIAPGILAGLTRGNLPPQSCSMIDRRLASDIRADATGEHSVDALTVNVRWAVHGTESPRTVNAAVPLHLGASTAPVMMLSGDRASGYDRVYDPLYSLKETLEFDYWRYWQYKDSPAYWASMSILGGAGSTSGIGLMVLGALSCNPLLALAGGAVTAVSLVPWGLLYNDWYENPQSRADNKQLSLARHGVSLKSSLETAHTTKKQTREALRALGMPESEKMLLREHQRYQRIKSLYEAQIRYSQSVIRQINAEISEREDEHRRQLQAQHRARQKAEQQRLWAATQNVGTPPPAYQRYDAPPPYTREDPYPEATARMRAGDTSPTEVPQYSDITEAPPAYPADRSASSDVSNRHSILLSLVRAASSLEQRKREEERHIRHLTVELEREYGVEGRTLNQYFQAISDISSYSAQIATNGEEQETVSHEAVVMTLVYGYQQATATEAEIN